MILYIILGSVGAIQMTILAVYNKNNENQGWFGKISLAGFPYSKPICKVVPSRVKEVNIDCDGDDTIIKVYDFGFLPRKIVNIPHHVSFQHICYHPEFRKFENYTTEDDYICDYEIRKKLNK